MKICKLIIFKTRQMENECLTELLAFIETTSQFYDFTQTTPRDQILQIVHRYVNILFRYPLLTGSDKSTRCNCPFQYNDTTRYFIYQYCVTVNICFQCGRQNMIIGIVENINITQMNSFIHLEYWVIRPFVLFKVRRQFEDWFFECLPIQDLIELVGDYLYVEPSWKRDTKRKLVFS